MEKYSEFLPNCAGSRVLSRSSTPSPSPYPSSPVSTAAALPTPSSSSAGSGRWAGLPTPERDGQGLEERMEAELTIGFPPATTSYVSEVVGRRWEWVEVRLSFSHPRLPLRLIFHPLHPFFTSPSLATSFESALPPSHPTHTRSEMLTHPFNTNRQQHPPQQHTLPTSALYGNSSPSTGTHLHSAPFPLGLHMPLLLVTPLPLPLPVPHHPPLPPLPSHRPPHPSPRNR